MHNVIVTGGSRGLGLAISRALAAAGYRVIALARNESEGLAVAKAEAAGKGAIEFRPFDLSRIEDMAQLARGLRKEFGPAWGLVNNAGLGTQGALATMPGADIEQLIRINTLAPIMLTKVLVRSMMADGGGRIVNISSVVASKGTKGASAYAATKASLIGFTHSLAQEVGQFAITVNAIAPGFMATDMTAAMADGELKNIARRSALRRLPEVDHVAAAVVHLMGESGRNITGTVLTIDAGNTA